MNKILAFLSCLIIFLGFANFSFAYDMEVQCSDVKCAVSSNAPIFPPEVHWVPNESVEKSIVIKNTSGSVKNIFFKTLGEGKPRELDEFINLKFYKQAESTTIWSGALKELLNENQISIVSLPSNGEFELVISAEMKGLTPNEAQGSSSVFDFGFGFEGDSSNNNSNNTNNGSNNSNSGDGGKNNEENQPQSFLGEILEGISTAFFGNSSTASVLEQNENNGEIAGEKDLQNPNANVMGVSDKCKDDLWWIAVLVLQALLSLLYFVKKINKKISVGLNGLGFVGASVYIYLTLCYLWPILISLGIFIIPVLFFKKEFIKSKLSFK